MKNGSRFISFFLRIRHRIYPLIGLSLVSLLAFAQESAPEKEMGSSEKVLESNPNDQKQKAKSEVSSSSNQNQSLQKGASKKKSNEVSFQTEIENPLKLRDPFKVPLKRKKKKSLIVDSATLGAEELIDQLDLNTLKIVGVLIGKKKRAFAKSGSNTLILKEGMKLGPDRITLKAILPGGIVLVEKVVNVYGQEEHLETVIPIEEDDEVKAK